MQARVRTETGIAPAAREWRSEGVGRSEVSVACYLMTNCGQRCLHVDSSELKAACLLCATSLSGRTALERSTVLMTRVVHRPREEVLVQRSSSHVSQIDLREHCARTSRHCSHHKLPACCRTGTLIGNDSVVSEQSPCYLGARRLYATCSSYLV